MGISRKQLMTCHKLFIETISNNLTTHKAMTRHRDIDIGKKLKK